MAAGTFNHFSQIAAALKPAVQKALTETAQAIEAEAKAASPVATGFLQSSIYSATPGGGSTYGQASTPPGDSYLLAEVQPAGDMEAVVGVAANYGIYVEMGHHVRGSGTYVPPQPYFYPAVDRGQAALDVALEKVSVDLQGVAAGGIV